MTADDLSQLKRCELLLLDELKRVCDELGILFFLDAGTLLGAVRHLGFIPWDDDIDVCMMREAYDKLMVEGPELLGDDFFLQTPDNSPQMPASFMKLRLNGTCMVETLHRGIPGNHGVWIDIFPFDYFDEQTDCDKLRKSEAFWGKIFDLSQRNMASEGLGPLKSFARGFVHTMLNLVPRKFLLSRMRMPAAPSGAADGYISCLHYGSLFFWLKWGEAFPPVEVTFEGRKLPALANYEDYLEQVYGDWRKLPPVEERVPHHFVLNFDLGKYAR